MRWALRSIFLVFRLVILEKKKKKKKEVLPKHIVHLIFFSLLYSLLTINHTHEAYYNCMFLVVSDHIVPCLDVVASVGKSAPVLFSFKARRIHRSML